MMEHKTNTSVISLYTTSAINVTANIISNSDIDCELSEERHCAILNNVKLTFNSLVLICVVLTIGMILLLRKYQNFAQLIKVIAMPLNKGQEGIVCTIQAFAIHASDVSRFLWMCTLTLYFTSLIILGNTHYKRKGIIQYERLCTVICLVTPLISASLPLITADYGPVGVFCWIGNSKSGLIWRLALWFVPVSLGNFVMLILYIVMLMKLEKQQRRYHHNVNRRPMSRSQISLRPSIAYTAVYQVVVIIQLFNRLHQYISDGDSFSLMILNRIVDSSFDIVVCAVFYLINGAEEFKLEKFQQNYLHHKWKISLILTGTTDDTVVPTQTVPQEMSTMFILASEVSLILPQQQNAESSPFVPTSSIPSSFNQMEDRDQILPPCGDSLISASSLNISQVDSVRTYEQLEQGGRVVQPADNSSASGSSRTPSVHNVAG